jgi:hypothetical protein
VVLVSRDEAERRRGFEDGKGSLFFDDLLDGKGSPLTF